MKRVISCVLLMLVLTSNAFALEVPTGTVVQNLNGSQQAIKTFTVSPEQDPAALIEEPFELEGYLYTFADIVKSENPVEEKRIHTEVITVETTKDDLALILEQLKPTIEYDDGRFQGTVAHFSRSLGISIDALVGIVPKGDVPSCVRTFFAGMSAEEAAKYIRLCKDADELTKK